MAVLGTLQAFKEPSWTCWLDGNPFSPNTTTNLTLNRVDVCEFDDILSSATSNHNLTVVASGTTDNPFLFDEITYVPDDSTILDNATVAVDAFDDQIQYDSEWTKLGIEIGTEIGPEVVFMGTQTSVQGASLTFDFVGALHS